MTHLKTKQGGKQCKCANVVLVEPDDHCIGRNVLMAVGDGFGLTWIKGSWLVFD
jgi:hypothetical protein